MNIRIYTQRGRKPYTCDLECGAETDYLAAGLAVLLPTQPGEVLVGRLILGDIRVEAAEAPL
jgi:hypothetical protein